MPLLFSRKELAQIEALAKVGCTRLEIASVIGRPAKELDKIDDKIRAWAETAKAAVKETAYKMAVSGKWPALTIFYLKTRCGWRETGAGGGGNEVGFVAVEGLNIADI